MDRGRGISQNIICNNGRGGGIDQSSTGLWAGLVKKFNELIK